MKIAHDVLYGEFINIAKVLNKELHITPILYGSLGLQQISGIDFSPEDIDILVPLEFLEDKWNSLKACLEGLGYDFVDLHEHEFRRNGIKTAFAFEEDLFPFAGVDDKTLEEVEFGDAKYRTLSLSDYLRVYSKSVHDSYRRTKNNNKDVKKIHVIKRVIPQ